MSGKTPKTLVMGVLNVTPDSFFDGGQYFDVDAAVAHGMDMIAAGADIIDVGGESTRPGAISVDADEECRRVLPVVSALVPHVRVSIDSSKEQVATAAVEAGATLINDVTASLSKLAASANVGWVAMHMQGNPQTMQQAPHYGDVVVDVYEELIHRADQAVVDGVSEVWIDPGIGFGKTLEHNLALLGALDRFVGSGYPVMIGVSRKQFLGTLAGGLDPEERLDASVAGAIWAASHGVEMVRVHDVAQTVMAMRLMGEEVLV
ncbi:MAG: dihydropteroate synthase [Acidimicrobiales bacterium]